MRGVLGGGGGEEGTGGRKFEVGWGTELESSTSRCYGDGVGRELAEGGGRKALGRGVREG